MELPSEMVRLYMTRFESRDFHRSGGRDNYLVQRDQLCSVEQVLSHLLEYELGYGGQITDATPESIEVTTRILSKIDITRISGTTEAMKPFLELALLWHQARDKVTGENLYDSFPEVVKKKTCWLVWSFGIFTGKKTLAIMTAMVLGFSEQEVRYVADHKVSIKDVLALNTLRNEGCDIQELLV